MDWITAAAELDQLRAEFPGWGIFHDPYALRWFAVRGRAEPYIAPTPDTLRQRLRSDYGMSSQFSGGWLAGSWPQR